MHRIVIGAAAVALTVASAADAGPARRSCRLLVRTTDGARDSLPAGNPDTDLRIESADVASSPTTLTTVVRVTDLDNALAAATGRSYGFYFSRSTEENYSLSVWAWPGKVPIARLGRLSGPYWAEPNNVEVKEYTELATGSVVFDTARDEVRMSVPLSAFGPGSTMRPGRPVNYLGAETARAYGADNSGTPLYGTPTAVATVFDFEQGGRDLSYVLGSPSCVAVGR